LEATVKKVSELERAMMELVYQSRLTEIKIAQLSEESRLTEIKIKQLSDEMKEFKEEMRASKKEMDKKWGELARKMGTLIEDIFIPSFDLAVEKYFNVTPKDVMPRRRIRKNGDTIEIDILALAADKALVVEVKASPDRIEYVHDFIEKLRKIPDFIPEIKNYKVIPIYAALNIQESTINYLTKNHIYAMIAKGDYLEIVNYEDIVS
jgi:chromosome segregation ATPase